MTRCRRKPLEFECWTWDGKNEASAPSWLPVYGERSGDLTARVNGDYRKVFVGRMFVKEHGYVRFLDEAEFNEEFDLVPEPGRCTCTITECEPCSQFIDRSDEGTEPCNLCGHDAACHPKPEEPKCET